MPKTMRGKRYRITINLFPEEMEKLEKQYLDSTYRYLTDYARKLLTQKPVKIFYRNKSFDEFVDVAIELRNELRRIGEGKLLSKQGEVEFLQVVKEIQLAINNLVDQCSSKYI